MFHCAANCTTLGAERELTAVGGVFYHGGVFAGQGGQDRQGQVLFTIFLRKHFRFWQEKGIFSEKLKKNHKKIAIFAVFGVDFAKGIEYNTLGILCKMQFLRTNPTVL